ncbi:hypothetical protein EJB05_19426 [Eragrostis curvula]|uniref:RING-type domain-containing protein n=1 Tax=Eragrostis curvula TaxID=38414 RepID=A0A5J9UXB1_9POAL|nr:hypothetical protein EJB05_19426 [Eragrostis curvula]
MSRASRVSNPPAVTAAAASKNVSSNGGHSDPSCSASVYQSFRPVTRSMTRVSPAIVASPDLKGGRSAGTSSRKSNSDASFSIQSAALRPTVTRARTPHKVTTSAWKPLTQPVALSEGQKCASFTTTNPTAKRSRVASSRAAKDSTNHSASRANSNVLNGKKNRDEETMSQGDQSDVAVMPSPTKKLQICKLPSDACSKRVSSIRILGTKIPAPPPTGKSQIETGNNSASISGEVVSANANDISLSAEAAVLLPAQPLQPETAKNSSVITESVSNEASQVQPLSAKVVLPRQKLRTDFQKMPSYVPMAMNQASVSAGAAAPMALPKFQKIQTDFQKMPSNVPMATNQGSGLTGTTAPMALPKFQKIQTDFQKIPSNVRMATNQGSGLTGATAPMALPKFQKIQTDFQKMPSNVPMATNQASGSTGATAPMALPKLQIGNVKDTSSILSNPAYARALLIKQQERLLQQYKLGSSQQQQQQQQELYIKGPGKVLLLGSEISFKIVFQKFMIVCLDHNSLVAISALPWSDETPPIEPLGTRCQLCKLDVSFRPRNDAGRDASAPPVVAVLACHHAFHSSCIESVYGLLEPSDCIACVEAGVVNCSLTKQTSV